MVAEASVRKAHIYIPSDLWSDPSRALSAELLQTPDQLPSFKGDPQRRQKKAPKKITSLV